MIRAIPVGIGEVVGVGDAVGELVGVGEMGSYPPPPADE